MGEGAEKHTGADGREAMTGQLRVCIVRDAYLCVKKRRDATERVSWSKQSTSRDSSDLSGDNNQIRGAVWIRGIYTSHGTSRASAPRIRAPPHLAASARKGARPGRHSAPLPWQGPARPPVPFYFPSLPTSPRGFTDGVLLGSCFDGAPAGRGGGARPNDASAPLPGQSVAR